MTSADQTQIDSMEEPNSGGIFNGLMLWAALRCSLQYLLFPFLLPVIRVSNLTSVWLNIGVSLLAIAIMGWNVIRLWNTSWRRRYLIWSLVAISIITVFLVADVKFLLSQ